MFNMYGLNKYLQYKLSKMETLETVAKFIQTNCYMESIKLKDA